MPTSNGPVSPKPATKVVTIRKSQSNLPDPDGPGNTLRPQLVGRTEARSNQRLTSLLPVCEDKLAHAFVFGAVPFKLLAFRYGVTSEAAQEIVRKRVRAWINRRAGATALGRAA